MTTVIYKCKCMPAERTINVPPRRPDEEVTDWITTPMGFAIYLDHRWASPECHASAMEYAKIALEGEAPLGEEAKRN